MRKSLAYLFIFILFFSLTSPIYSLYVNKNDLYNLPSLNKKEADSSPFIKTSAKQKLSFEISPQKIQSENSEFFQYNVGIDPETALPFNHLFVHPNGKTEIGHYNSPTDIGLYSTYLVGVAKGDIENDTLSPSNAMDRLNSVLKTLKNVPKKDGLLYWYDIGSPKVKLAKYGEEETPIVPTVDNAFYAASLGVIIGAFKNEESKKAQKLVESAKRLLGKQKKAWKKLYDSDKGLIKGEYGKESSYYIDDLYSEGRLAILMSMVLGDISKAPWKNTYKALSNYTLRNGEQVQFIAPRTGAFQAWMPLMFVPEMKWSPDGFKKAHENYLSVQNDWAEKENMPTFYSECSDPFSKDKFKYRVKIAVPNGGSQISNTGVRYVSNIGSIYSIGLASMVDSKVAEKKIAELLTRFPEIEGSLGWYDSVGREGYEPNVNWEVSNSYVSKDQSLFLNSFNYENIQRYFKNFLQEYGKLKEIRTLYNSMHFPID